MKTKSSFYFFSKKAVYFKNKYLFDDKLNKKEWISKRISIRAKL